MSSSIILMSCCKQGIFKLQLEKSKYTRVKKIILIKWHNLKGNACLVSVFTESLRADSSLEQKSLTHISTNDHSCVLFCNVYVYDCQADLTCKTPLNDAIHLVILEQCMLHLDKNMEGALKCAFEILKKNVAISELLSITFVQKGHKTI